MVSERNPVTYPDEDKKPHIHPYLLDLLPSVRAAQLRVQMHPRGCCLFLLNKREPPKLLEHSNEEKGDFVQNIVLPQALQKILAA